MYLVLCMLCKHVQGSHCEAEFAAVGELAYTCSKVHQLLPRDLQQYTVLQGLSRRLESKITFPEVCEG